MEAFLPLQNDNLKGHKLASSLKFYFKSSAKEARRKKLYFCLAILSTLIVVTATALAQSLIHYAPLIFLKVAESSEGAIDVRITPTTVYVQQNGGPVVSKRLLFNSTQVSNLVRPIFSDVSTARYTLDCVALIPEEQCYPPYANCRSWGSQLVLQNTQKEAELEIGNDLPLPNMIPQGSVITSRKQASVLGVNVGDTFIIQADISEILSAIAGKYNLLQESDATLIDESSLEGMYVNLPVTVAGLVDELPGKFPDGDFVSVMLYEYSYFLPTIMQYPPPRLSDIRNSEPFLDFLSQEPSQNYADQIIFNMKNRQDVYLESNFDDIQDEVINFGSDIAEVLGVFPYIMSLPVYDSLSGLSFGSMFLGIVLNIMIVVLFLLSIILIYNLLMVTLDTRTFDFGVIRMLGLTKLGIGQLIFIQALSFVIPGVLLGLGLSIPLFILLGSILEDKLGADIPSTPNGTAFLWSSLVGILIPIVSSYYPVKSALSKDLNSSLDVVHSKTSAVQIKIEVDSKKIPWVQITFGVLTVVFGVVLYILLPLALLSSNLGLLLTLFFCILIGILIGLSLLSLNFQHLMEKVVSQICLFWTSTPFRRLVIKNLAAHKLRNRHVAIMYALALGFVIFIKVTLNQELKSISFQTEAARGAYLQVTGLSTLSDQMRLQRQLESYSEDVIESFAWITKDLSTFLTEQGVGTAKITHRGQLYEADAKIVGVSPTIFQTTINQFLSIDEQDDSTGLDLGEQLYTPRGSQGAIVGEYYRKYLGASLNYHSSIIIEVDAGVDSRKEEMRVIGSLKSAPGFTFSDNPSVTDQHVLVSIPTYRRLAGNTVSDINDVPMDRLLIKVKDDSDENLNKVYSLLTSLKQNYYGGLVIWDIRDSESGIANNQGAINLIFITVEIVVIILSLFSLMTSMSTNILEQTKEIAVLRAVGITKLKINMMFVSESFVLVFSSALFGILIGTLVAWILAIQRILFTQLPLQFQFPWVDLIIIFVMAIISGFLSSYLPARRITKLQISKINRLAG